MHPMRLVIRLGNSFRPVRLGQIHAVNIWLGKWISEDSYGQLGFWHRPLCGEEVNSKALGELALRFIAKHLDHDIQALPEHKFERIEDEYGDRLSEIESPHTQEGPR